MSTAYTTEKTWATNDDITAALLNTHIRDNSQFLHQPPACRAYNNANISHSSSGSYQFLTFNSERKDTDTMHSTSSNTGRITATTAGFYEIGGCVEFASNATGLRGLEIRLNGSTVIVTTDVAAISGAGTDLNVSTMYQLAAADYVELGAYQSSGGTLNVSAVGNYSPEFWCAWQAA